MYAHAHANTKNIEYRRITTTQYPGIGAYNNRTFSTKALLFIFTVSRGETKQKITAAVTNNRRRKGRTFYFSSSYSKTTTNDNTVQGETQHCSFSLHVWHRALASLGEKTKRGEAVRRCEAECLSHTFAHYCTIKNRLTTKQILERYPTKPGVFTVLTHTELRRELRRGVQKTFGRHS